MMWSMHLMSVCDGFLFAQARNRVPCLYMKPTLQRIREDGGVGGHRGHHALQDLDCCNMLSRNAVGESELMLKGTTVP